MHERYGRTSKQLANELDDFADLIGKKIFISNNATQLVDDMAEILSGVDAGLAFYKPDYGSGPLTGNNLKFLGLASGKISTYLRYRISVIVNEIGLFADQVREYQLGSVVNGPDQIPAALIEVGDVDARENIEQYFTSKLDFDVYADKVLAKVESVIGGH